MTFFSLTLTNIICHVNILSNALINRGFLHDSFECHLFCIPILGSPCSVLSSISCLSSPSRSSLDSPCAGHLKTAERQTPASPWPVALAFITCWWNFQAGIFVLIPLQSMTRRSFLCRLKKLPPCLPLYFSLNILLLRHTQNKIREQESWSLPITLFAWFLFLPNLFLSV